MAKKRLDFFSFKVIFIFIPIILVTAFKPQIGLSQEALGLSGRYKGGNVILIILDALRPGHLSCYGYNKKTSPNIDALAKQGVLFSNAFSQASYTLPSVTSIFTSVHPYSHRVCYVSKDKVPDKLYTLAQILGIYGYNTAWFGKLNDPQSGSVPGVLKGFNEKYQAETIEEEQKRFHWIKTHKNEPFFITIHSYLSHENTFPFIRFDNKFSRSISKVFLDSFVNIEKKRWDKLQGMVKDNSKKAISAFGQDWIRKNNQYLMAPYSDEAFVGVYALTQNSEQRRLLEQISNDIVFPFFRSFDNEQLLFFKSLLDSAIYEIDRKMVGDIVKELKELGLYDKTIVVITADHGDEFMEHGEFGHGKALYDESIHIPLIYYIPHLNKAVIIKDLVESIDILPTILDLLSIPMPAQTQGISLLGLIEGKNNALKNAYVFSQAAPVDTLAIRSKDWKLIRKPQEGKDSSNIFELSLFDLKRDPRELHNLINEKQQVARLLKSRLDEWMKGLVVYQEEESKFIPSLDEETKQRIKKTGYW